MDGLLLVLAYLIGSLNLAIVVGRLKHLDIRQWDIAGASGVFRQFGPMWGIGVGLADIGRGMLAALLAQAASPEVRPWMGAALTTGHIWPVFFGFRGGGGLAPAFGYVLYLLPGPALIGLVLALAIGALHKLTHERLWPQVGWLPFGAIFGFAYVLALTWGEPDFAQLSLPLAPLAIRALLVLSGRWWG
ncbi:glycerol-3-phosphate acyltransferase [Calidithermus timidus]|jgi:glycerol-3-phosphate acyltransferase PlsY|uniref:glycerol-3-phosphate acyltransferase n=1 Tax=Calidithermus timidus TaxID=307124 RepID=UPI00037883B8|nr:glycerol-3-phosphate acyltransferase [Calidithermus timidus]